MRIVRVAIAWQKVSIARVVRSCKRCTRARWTCIEKMFLSNQKKAHGVYEIGLGVITWQIKRIMSISSMFAWERTLWQSQTQHGKVFEVVLQNYAGHPLKGTFGTHYSEPISLFWLKVTLSWWQPISVITTDCLTATDITSLKTCLAYYRLVPLVGCVSDRYCQSFLSWDCSREEGTRKDIW